MIESRFNDVPLGNASLKMFRFKKDGREKAYTLITLSTEEHYYIRGKAEDQLYNHLKLSVKNLEHMPWQERDKVLSDILANTNTGNIILRTCEDFAYAVVTDKYTGVRHTELWNRAENLLRTSNVEFVRKQPMNLKGRMLVKYVFPKLKVNNTIATGLYISNSATGESSIRTGRYAEVLICNNGLIGEEYDLGFSRVHVGDKDKILSQFDSAVTNVINSLSDQLVELNKVISLSYLDMYDMDRVQSLREVMAKKKVPLKYLSNFHSSVELLGFAQDGKPLTAYEVANILSRVAGTAPPETKVQLEGVAYQILTGSIREQMVVVSS